MDSRIGPKFLKSICRFWRFMFSKRYFKFGFILQNLFGLNEVADYWEQVIIMNDHQKEDFLETL